MARVLITGMSGAGKSTLLAALAGRGYRTVDTDYDGWTLSTGLWDVDRMAQLLDGGEANSDEDDVIVSGTVQNQGDFYDRFEHVVLLSAPLDVLLRRVATRSTNPYGRTAAEQADIARYVATVEPLLRATATAELDGQRDPDDLATAVQALMAAGPGRIG